VLCKKTKTLLPVPETLNYFDLFGLPEPTFKIDLKALDANFLAEIVELNEEIIEAEGPTEVAGLMTHVRDHLQTLFDKAEVAFDVDSDLDRARLVTAQIRYYENLKKKLVERETEFGMIR